MLSSGAPLSELPHVRVELSAMLRRQRNAEVVALRFKQLLRLLALRGRLRPQSFHSGRIATLTGLSSSLHLRLELLAQ